MGSLPSTPTREGTNDNNNNNVWWQIENQNLTLDTSPVLIMAEQQQQGHSTGLDQSDRQSAANSNISENVENVLVNSSVSQENSESANDADQCDHFIEIESVESTSKNKLCSNSSKENKEQTLEEFKEDLRMKREQRRNILSDLRDELTTLRQQLAEERAANHSLRKICEKKENFTATLTAFDDADNLIKCESLDNDGVDPANKENNINNLASLVDHQQKYADHDGDDDNSEEAQCSIYNKRHSEIALKTELANCQLSLQLANADVLSLTSELDVTRKQVVSLKEVIGVSKQMVEIRENQLVQLKGKLKEIEDSLAEREMKIMSDNLRQEYDRQLTNIRNLRSLYEERARVSAAERENLIRQLDTKRTELDTEIEKTKNLEERVLSLQADLEATASQLTNTKEELSEYKADNKGLHEEMAVINQLFSQLLMGFNGGNVIDIDKLTNMLEDHRDLLNDITNKETCKDGAAALPKLLFDLVSQSEENNDDGIMGTISEESAATISNETDITESELTSEPPKTSVSSAKEIVDNLPKVWKVLIELLNHQKAEKVSFNENGESEDCYNSVQTPNGPKLVLSVSKTYIKLKDLILEKKFLQKETTKLKNLNNHLECRLSQQENRLGAVSIELNKTWTLVGRMQRQHRQLHTHEQVLRYQLQQKRRMLTELKDELEYCRRKWALAREKNNETQGQWNTLRLEFSNRKKTDSNNSAESGYSDDPLSDEDISDTDVKASKYESTSDTLKLFIPSSRQPVRVQSVSPARNIQTENIRRNSAPPSVSLMSSELYQTVLEMLPQEVELHTADAKQEVQLDYAAALSSVVPPPIDVAEVIVKSENKTICEPSTSKGRSTQRPNRKSKQDSSRLKLSREIRIKEMSKKKKKKKPSGEESLEEMFFRISGQEAPEETESSEESESESEEELMSDDSEVVDESSSQVSVPPIQRIDFANTAGFVALMQKDEERRIERAERFQRLEEQCQQLITKVVKSSNRGDELNTQIVKVQQRYSPKQSQSSNNNVDSTNTDDSHLLTQREQEFTSRRAARLLRLEEECQAFLSKVNRTNEKASEMSSKIGDLHAKYNKTEEPQPSTSSAGQATQKIPSQSTANQKEPALTPEEEAYTARRAERIRRLEQQSAELLAIMNKSAQRANTISDQLDDVHNRYVVRSNKSVDQVASSNADEPFTHNNESCTNVTIQENTTMTNEISNSNIVSTTMSNSEDEMNDLLKSEHLDVEFNFNLPEISDQDILDEINAELGIDNDNEDDDDTIQEDDTQEIVQNNEGDDSAAAGSISIFEELTSQEAEEIANAIASEELLNDKYNP